MTKAWATVLCVTCAALCAGPVRAGGSGLSVLAQCGRAPGPGRVLCEVSAKPESGRLVWSDVLVVHAPEFARPLRSRVVLELGANPQAAAATLALVASQAGQGKLDILVRGVICSADQAGAAQRCKAVAQPVSAVLEVGAAVSKAP
ncbi:MAG: hypothetical protein ABI488_10830 [Polyangiaceae bacterium]